ncbi:gamma carbonic anhydrase family protein [Candidatus Aciduliprofundum boonei]|uniref:Ferripyochelin binding protein n=1 Tax=Aciduliprofundum boonei (strain DSM 19572 / T469) TaxID=439481 RepID=B5ID83_ACIB4|nr:gamma carbonic anhydrase family protein [Candidatus Aciduliprofundum boonei]ADD08770.1 ferripyochelin binding protein [Aciduliprofundum boonei T469]EDY35759.1 Bacterial transferase hexapeptide repeat protein [Aciduliprofundum boonei T469]HII55668.1 gamma carbonic anhydrase family protein [Candidatus Aciduliprofundum boonei]
MEIIKPRIHNSAYIAPTATIIGDVEIEEGASVWDGAVLRGDVSYIKIGKNTNIQDNAVVHVDYNDPTIIGENVTIGHMAVVHAAKIGNNVIVGIHAVILNGAEIGDGSVVGAGAVVTSRTKIPPKSLVLGIPAKVVRQGEEIEKMAIENGLIYQKLREEHKSGKYARFIP